MNMTTSFDAARPVSGIELCRESTSKLGLSVCCLALILSACARGDNIRPGEPDYPEENTQPTRILHLRGDLPESMPLRIDVSYVAVKGGFEDTSDCSFYPSERGLSAFSIQESVASIHANSTYTADVVFDKYKPGRCQWSLSSIDYWLEASSPREALTREPDAYVISDLRQKAHPAAQVGDLQRDIWCAEVVGDGKAGRKYRCDSESTMASEQVRSEAQTHPVEDSTQRVLHLAPDTRSITINFHTVTPSSQNVSEVLKPRVNMQMKFDLRVRHPRSFVAYGGEI